MKKLTLFAAVALLSAAAFGQDQIGSACTNSGAFSRADDVVLSCSKGKWVKFSTVGDKNVLITYEIFKGKKSIDSGLVRSRDGGLASHAIRSEINYLAEATMGADGKAVLKPGTLVAGVFLSFVPVLSGGDTVAMHFSFLHSDLLSLQTVTSGGLAVQVPDLRKVSADQSVVMHLGKEMVIALAESSADAADKYTLKLTTSME